MIDINPFLQLIAKNPNFTIELCDIKNYSIAEQTKFKKFLDKLDGDLNFHQSV